MEEPASSLGKRIHLFQWRIIPGQVDGNLGRADDLLGECRPREGDLVVLPEMFSSGFFYQDLPRMADETERVLAWMSERAAGSGSAIVGSVPVHRSGGIANSMIFVDGTGRVQGSYDKVHLFPLSGEDRSFSEGDRTVCVLWNGIPSGLLICFDLRYPEMARKLCLEGVQLILVSAQWPASRIGHFRDLVRVRAMENQLLVAAANSCGEDAAGLLLGGRSRVADPMGRVIGELEGDEGILSVAVDLEGVDRTRKEFPVLSLRRPDVYG
ncbi:MAG: carbon-nitrogen family hydrolase [bacterium]|nr:MAG: carbon-nitrogen family hydrolase [bacterium]